MVLFQAVSVPVLAQFLYDCYSGTSDSGARSTSDESRHPGILGEQGTLVSWPKGEPQGRPPGQMTIAKRIMLGYGVLLIVVFFHLLYSLSSLKEMGRINHVIMKLNTPTIDTAERLVDNLLGQELYARRLGILKDRESFTLLQQKIAEFDQLIREIASIGNPFVLITELVTGAKTYRKALASGAYGSFVSAQRMSGNLDEDLAKQLQGLVDLCSTIAIQVRIDQNAKSRTSETIGRRAYQGLLIVGIGSVLLVVGITVLFARYISRSVKQLKRSTELVSESKFSALPSIENKDEFGEVSRSIFDMAKKIERLEKLHIACNPLSLLPGGLAIDETISFRLASGKSTAVCIMDLDNFKAFNDRYGYARGNDAIRAAAGIIQSAVGEKGKEDDFVGHIGGDDFIVVTRADRYKEICETIIARFDERIPLLYDAEDRANGVIIGNNRQGVEVVFPLMTISIAVATDQEGTAKDPQELSRRAAELKEHAKSQPGSVFIVDQRRFAKGEDA